MRFFRASRPVFRPTPPGGPVKSRIAPASVTRRLKRYVIPVRIIIPRLLFCPVQRVSSLALLTFLPPSRAVRALITLSAITCQPCRVSPFCPVHWLICMLPATLRSSPLRCLSSASACLPNARTDNHIVAVPSSAWLHGRGPPYAPASSVCPCWSVLPAGRPPAARKRLSVLS